MKLLREAGPSQERKSYVSQMGDQVKAEDQRLFKAGAHETFKHFNQAPVQSGVQRPREHPYSAEEAMLALKYLLIREWSIL